MLGDVVAGECLVRTRLNTIVHEGTETRLEPKAMSVLVLLMARAGEVVSRDEILSRVWEDRVVSDEVLTNAVSQLRRAFGDPAREPRYIQTIAKGGYRFIAPTKAVREGLRVARLGAGLAGVAVLATLVAVGLHVSRPPPTTTKTGLVRVNEFVSLSQDRELDWLRAGIPDLMVTALSQTPRFRVVGPTSPPEIGDTAEFEIDGSFVRLDTALRVNAFARDVASGEILVAESVQTRSPGELFELIDGLAARVSMRLALARDDEPHLRRALHDVTTDSLEAYRYYVEGMRLYYYNLDHVGAIDRYEKAVEIDPSFALAHAKMSLLYMNVGDAERANRASRRALENVDRLPARERQYVTGNFYVAQEEGYARALEAYAQALALDPDHVAARHNRGFIFFRLERYREAVEELEPLVERGVAFPGSYRLLMLSHAALAEFDRGRRVADAYLTRHPEKWIGHRDLGQHLMRWGRLEEANASLTRADALHPEMLPAVDWWQLKLLRDEPIERESESARGRSAEPRLGRAMQALYRGRPNEAIRALEDVARGEDGGDWASVALGLAAAVELQVGDPEASLRTARRARELGRGSALEWHALALASIARAELGDWEGARRLAAELETRTASIPTRKERRRLHHLRGELARVAGEPAQAIEALRAAESLLAPRGFPVTMQLPQHVPIRYARAEAHRASGEHEPAIRWFRSVTESTTERLVWPDPLREEPLSAGTAL